jgi:hypothetical protein
MTISFTQALLIFTFTQIPLYFLMLLVADKRGSGPAEGPSRRNGLDALAFTADKASFALSAVGLFLTLSTNFRETAPYFAMVSLALLTNVLGIILKGPSGLALGSFVLWHLMMYSDRAPAIDVAVGEGSGMVREMSLNDHWRFEWAHNPSYNPLPTVAFLQATLSRITGMNWYSYCLGQVVFLPALVAYDLAIYALTYVVTKDRRVALMSIPLVAITPETPIHQHPYQWSGNALVIMASALLVRAIEGERPGVNFMAIMLLFTGAILAHVTGLSYIFLLTSLLLVAVLRRLPRKRSLSASLNARWLARISGVLLVVLLARSVYTQGYLEYVYPSMASIYQGLANLIREFFMPSGEMGGAVHVPLYERAGVPWIQAYAWSYALAVATAYVLYFLIRGRARLVEVALYITCALFLSIAYLGYGLFGLRQFYPLNRTTYVFIPLIYPLAAKALANTFGGLKRASSRPYFVAALVGLALFIAVAPIATQDPNISPIQYAKIRQCETVPIEPSDIAEAKFVLRASDGLAYYTYSHSTYKTGMYRLSTNPEERAVGIWYPVLTTRLKSAIELCSFLNKLRPPNMEVLMLSERRSADFDMNLVYNSYRDFVYVR